VTSVYTNTMSKAFWAIIAVILIVFGGILLFKDNKANAPTSSSNGKPTQHVQGKGSTGVTLVEYGDYQCPFCGQYYPIVKAVEQKYNDQITFQFRNLPLLQIHQNAFAAARAAEAAGLQNKFWEMYDKLYENQDSWSSSKDPLSVFTQYATQIGLKTDTFKTDFASSSVNDAINADIKEFNKTGAEMSTPTFFLDGKKISPKSVDEFSKFIDAAIADKQKQ
jgi:protein-disulfide isomerase